MKVTRFLNCGALAALALGGMAVPAWAIHWESVPGRDVVMLYPGQTSWEWNLTEADHSAAGKFKAGKNCIACHKGEEVTQGALMVSGKKAEPTPIPSFPGHVVANVRFAYDSSNFYTRLEYAEPVAPDAKMDANFTSKVSLIFNSEAVSEGVRAGCWASCHEDNASMPAANGSERTKYLMKTRVKLGRMGGGDALKSAEDLQTLKDNGYVQEWWQVRLNPKGKGQTVGGIIFDKREEMQPAPVKSEATYSPGPTGTAGTWVVVLTRPLAAAAPFVPLVEGKNYTFGISVHLGHSAKRFHHTSYEYTMSLGASSADFQATKVAP